MSVSSHAVDDFLRLLRQPCALMFARAATFTLFFACAVTLALALPARAAERTGKAGEEDGRSRQGAVLRLYFENDLFYNEDRDYTNAVQLRVISPDLQTLAENELFPQGLSEALGKVPFPGYRGAVRYSISGGMGQHIYTPKDTGARNLQKHDRPYAGYLYGMLALHAKRYGRLDTLEIAAGVIGPSSLAEQAQNEVHRFRGFDTAKGWQHQLRDEATLMLTWSRVWRLNENTEQGGWGWDALPLVNVSLGTPFTRAGLGSEFRFGWNLPADYGSSTIRPGAGISRPLARSAPGLSGAMESSGAGIAPPLKKTAAGQGKSAPENFWDGFSLYAFAGGDGYAVARDSFLDGNLWKDSHDVRKFPFAGELYCGLGLIIQDFQITYTHVYKSQEFHGGREHRYGSIAIAYRF